MGRSGIRGKDSRDWHHDDVDGYDSRYWGLDDGLADRLGIKAPDGWKPKSKNVKSWTISFPKET